MEISRVRLAKERIGSGRFLALYSLALFSLALSIGACGGGGSSKRGVVSGPNPPPIPTGLAAQGMTSEILITWNPVGGATSYNLYWSNAAGVTPAAGSPILGAVSPYLHATLSNGTTYYYVVTASDGTLESAASPEALALPLDPPSGVSAAAGDTEITITWSPVTGATGYDLYWSNTQGVTPGTGNSIPGVASGLSHSGLLNGVIYYYVVTATNSVGGGTESVESAETFSTPSAMQGILDPSFGGGQGWIVHGDAAGGGYSDWGRALALDAMGRIVVAGYSYNSNLDQDMVLWRFDDTGAIDTSFGAGGVAIHHDAAGGNADDAATHMVLDAMGRIVVTGSSWNSTPDFDTVIWRYDTNGILDTSFGGRGWVVHDDAGGGGGTDRGEAVAIDSQGRILVTGFSLASPSEVDMVIWRYESNGDLDLSFGSAGVVTHNSAAGGGGIDVGFSILVDSADRICVGGASSTTPFPNSADMAIWRYDSSGNLDLGFGLGGYVVHGNAAGGNMDDIARDVVVDATGRILTTGYSWSSAGDMEMVIWAYDSTGNLDASFGSSGVVLHGNAAGGNLDDFGNAITLTGSGNILVTGDSRGPGADQDMVIWCYDATGNLEPLFASGGIFVHDSAAGGMDDDVGSDITMDAMGRIVVCGFSMTSSAPGSADLVIWRLR
ncbi:MAG: fibronectin type III domain-containing protein [Planctomycetota bacterium]|nr:fibronectin type III domain-containing protein [Planctomycetota bacterium]